MTERTETRRTEEPGLLSMEEKSLCWFKRSLKIKWQKTDMS